MVHARARPDGVVPDSAARPEDYLKIERGVLEIGEQLEHVEQQQDDVLADYLRQLLVRVHH